MNQSLFPTDPNTKVTTRDLFSAVFRYRLLSFVVFIGVLLGSIAFSVFWVARYYQSQMQFLVDQSRADPSATAMQDATVMARVITPDQISSEVALLQGGDMLKEVAGICGLANESSVTDVLLPQDPALRKAAKIEKATVALAKALHVEAEKTSNVITVSYGRTGSPDTPVCVLDNLAKLYVERHLQLQRPQGTAQIFAEQAAQYQNRLAASESRLISFGRESGIAAPDAVRPYLAQQLAMSISSGYQLREQISGDKQRILDIQSQMRCTPARSLSQQATAPANNLVQQLEDDRVVAQNKRTALAIKNDVSYPLVREADEEIANIDAAIAAANKTQFTTATTDRDVTFEALRADLAKSQSDLASHVAAAAANSNSNEQMRKKLLELDEKSVQQAALVRDIKANETSYLLYLNKREEQRLSDALDRKRIVNVALAVPPIKPVLPAYSPYLISCIGLVLASIAAFGAANVKDYFDPTFRDSIDVSMTLELPVLASLPRLES